MKKQNHPLTLLLLTVLLLSGALLKAQDDGVKLYLTEDEVPNAVYWIPEPPEPGSSQFMYDISQYYWGKEQRLDTLRAQRAIREAEYLVAGMAEQFSEAFGMEISEENTPAIYNLVNRGLTTIRMSATKPKATYMRTRPYVYFNEPTLVPEEEEELRTNGSYPSGHAIKGWGMALLLSEINPYAQDELLQMGYEWGQSRVIVGYHWQSDVDASRLLASACYARLHSCKEFIDDMAAAKKEFNKKFKKNGEVFNLTKQEGHYVFTSSINGVADATILLESGISALLIDSAYVFNKGVLSNMELTSTGGKEKMNLAGRVYVITHKANGTIKIGKNTSYIGEVFVLSNYDYGHYEVAVPIMYLHNDIDDGSRIVNLDLGNKRMQLLSRESLNENKAGCSKLKMNSNTYLGMPAVETSLIVDDGVKTRKLAGNFLVDLGNPELLFLIHQTKEVQKFLADNADLEINEARDPKGNVMAQYFIANQCQLCGMKFPTSVIAITKNLPEFDAPGNLGLKFFEQVNALLDFDKLILYTK